MSMQLNEYLAAAIKRLGYLEAEISKKNQNQYSKDIEDLKMLIELLKEQFKNENSNNSIS